MFKKYMHLERFGTSAVDGIEIGVTYVFPKIDGTNASVWLSNEGLLSAGSRNRELSFGKDNAGFYAWAVQQTNLKLYLEENPTHTLYGEWLVPHSLKTYREDAWRNFYIFDVLQDETLLSYDEYKDGLKKYGLTFLSPIAVINNGSEEIYQKTLERNTVLIKDGEGVGEGVVIKNYDYTNKFGQVVWAKIVTNSFKEKHREEMGVTILGQEIVEEKIVREFVTEHLVSKVHSKICVECDGWSSKYIPRLLNTVWHDLITEEVWEILKKYKNPKINFKTLNRLTSARIKQLMPELF